MWAALNRSVLTRCSTYLVATAIGSFFFERTFEIIVENIFEAKNKGKLWKDVQHRFQKPKEDK